MHHDPEPRGVEHPPPSGGDGRLWLIAGTGEGPVLAGRLLARGWRLKVSVVTAVAALAYPRHPGLEVAVGAIGGTSLEPGGAPERGVAGELDRAREAGAPYHLVLDATHPFATRISAALAAVCGGRGQPLLRLRRPMPAQGPATLLESPADLQGRFSPDEPLMLAIGARRLAEVVHLSSGARHHARILPSPLALRQALAAGLAPERLACLRPGGSGAIERALCRRWGIRTVLCRQSGGTTEALWRDTCRSLGLRLLLLARPDEPGQGESLMMDELIEHVGWPGGRR